LIALHTGLPINVTTGADNALTGTPSQRPNQVGSPFISGGRPLSAVLQTYYNPAAFAAPTLGGAYGNVGRNSLVGPGFATTNMGMFKNFSLVPGREDVRLQFRAEFFNLFNRANFSNPGGSLSSGANMFRIGSANDPRIVQFALKILF
jgi:hypothetical protein